MRHYIAIPGTYHEEMLESNPCTMFVEQVTGLGTLALFVVFIRA